MSGLKIHLAALPLGASQVRLEADAASLGLEPREWPVPVTGEALVEKNGDRVTVRGRLETRARLECVRCLRTFEMPVMVPLEVFAERSGTHPQREEQALERDNVVAFHDGRELDVSGEARDALLLEVPMAPRCREDCAGLCPRCGADRNEGPCACAGGS
jgi:uncharacterized protein